MTTVSQPDDLAAERRAWGPDEFEIEPPAVAAAARSRELDLLGVTRALGHDVTPGHDELHHYWTRGEGLAKWAESPKPWTTLHALLTEAIRKNGRAVSPEQIDNMVSAWVHEVTGLWSGSDVYRVEHGGKPRGHRIGPG